MPDLYKAAVDARENAYAPYSGYKVGAAVEDEQGRVWCGCNVENVSYGATICAERSAILKMVSEGGRSVRRLALITEDAGTPCGMCLQVILEFVADPAAVAIEMYNENGQKTSKTLQELLPFGFRSHEVSRTDEG